MLPPVIPEAEARRAEAIRDLVRRANLPHEVPVGPLPASGVLNPSSRSERHAP
jgi:hypothetical protein